MPQKRPSGAAADDEAERLKEQNRVHQKQFRERRKEKFKLLEERVAELERELSLSVTRQSGSVSSSSVYVTPPIQSDDPVLVLGSVSRASVGVGVGVGIGINPNPKPPSNHVHGLPELIVSTANLVPTDFDLVRTRIDSLEAENQALKTLLAQQQQALQIQSFLAALPPPPPPPPPQLHITTPLSAGSASTSIPPPIQYSNPFTTVVEPVDLSWRDFLNFSDSAQQDDKAASVITTITQPHMYSTPTLLSTSRASFITLTEIVQAANQMLLHVDTLSAPNCDIARAQLLSIPSLSLKPESVDPICNSFLALCDYVVDLEVSRTAPDPAVTGKLLIDLTMAKYRVLDMCKYGEERKRALDVMSDLRFDMNRQYKVLVAKQLPSLFLLDADPIGLSQLTIPTLQDETNVFYRQCMQIPALAGSPFIERVFDGARCLMANQDSTSPEILQSRCFWYQYYMHVLIPLLCTAPDRLLLEHLVDYGRMARKAAFDDIVDALDKLDL